MRYSNDEVVDDSQPHKRTHIHEHESSDTQTEICSLCDTTQVRS